MCLCCRLRLVLGTSRFVYLLCCLCDCHERRHIQSYKLLPETKGVPIEEMITVWRDHPHWSKYFYEDDAKFETNKSKVIGFY